MKSPDLLRLSFLNPSLESKYQIVSVRVKSMFCMILFQGKDVGCELWEKSRENCHPKMLSGRVLVVRCL